MSLTLVPTAHLLGPIVGLNLWTFVMEGWMYNHRIRWMTGAYQQADQKQQKPIDLLTSATTKAQFDAMQPPFVRWKADNYNHLFEQPTQFYAVAVVLALCGASGKVDLGLAWGYVGLRVVHSLVQCCGNVQPLRFQLYIASSAVLLATTVRAGLAVAQNLMN